MGVTSYRRIVLAQCFLMAVMSSYALGNDSRTGNSGDGVVCYDDAQVVRQVLQLDFYEASVLADPPGSYVLDLGAASLSMVQKIEYVLQKLARLDSQKAEKYRAEAQLFLQQVKVIHGTTFIIIPDTDPIVFPQGCRVEQLAIQLPQEDRPPGYRKYNVNGDLWQEQVMSNDDRAGLVLHEIIYNEALAMRTPDGERVHKNSRNVRKFTAFIASQVFNAVTPEQYQAKLADVKLKPN